jgi:hypothetical protein
LKKDLKSVHSLVEAAKKWASKGLQIVPLQLTASSDGGKTVRPLYKWQTEPYPGFENLRWEEANAYAIVLGAASEGWLACVDVDTDAPVRHDPFTTLVKAFPEIENTYIEKTPHGFHFFVYIDKPPEAGNVNLKAQYGLELHVNGLVIMAPSSYEAGQYSVYHEAEIVKIPDFYEQFTKKFGRRWFNSYEKPRGGYKGPEPPCVNALLEGVKKGLRNETGIRLAAYFLNFRGLSRTEAQKQLSRWNLRNQPPLPDSELKNIIKSAAAHGYVYGCQDEILSRFCKREACPFAGTEETRRVVRTPSVELPDGRLVEEAFDGKDVFFLVYNPQTGRVEKAEEVECEGTVYKPIKSLEVEKGLTLLPSEAVDYESEDKLLKDIIELMNRWHEAPNEFERQLDALYVLITYIADLLPRIPYRRALGAYGRGKSAWLQTVGFICYRPLIVAGCSTDIAIVRRIDLWRGTALIDEADFANSGLYAFVIKVLNVGYDKDLGFYQRADDINPRKTLFFRVYGPKLLATRREFRDTALESRCLTFLAREKSRSIPLYRNERFKAEAQELRNKLIMWRFKNYHKLKAKISQLESPDFEKSLGFNVSSRIKEIIAPLILLGDQYKPIVEKVALELEAQLLTDPEVQLELAFNQALGKIFYNLEENQEGVNGVNGFNGVIGAPLKLENFTDKTKKETFLHIPLTRIAKTILDDENPDDNQLKGLNQKLARVIRSRLGFRVFRGPRNRTYVEVPLSYKPLKPLKQVTPRRVIMLKHFDLKATKPTSIQLNMLNQLRADAEKIKQRGVWIVHKGWFAGSLNRKYSVAELRDIAEKLPQLSYIKDGKTDRIRVPPHLTLKELMAKTAGAEGTLSIEISSEATRESFEAELEKILKRPKPVIFRPLWALWLPPYRHVGLAYTRHIPKDILICEELHLTETIPTKILTPQVAIKSFTTESVPGCFGRYGRPIAFWQYGCSMCAWHKQCLQQTTADMRENWSKAVKVERRRRYAYITINLAFTPFQLNAEGQKKLQKHITNYIVQHWSTRAIRKQWFAVNLEYCIFKVFRKDLEETLEKVVSLLEKHAELREAVRREVEKNG